MKKLLLVALVLTLVALPAMSQEQTGRIQGRVETTDGKAVVGAKVSVASSALIRSLSTMTDDKGRFRFPNLPVGEYSIAVSAEQYKGFEQGGINVRIGSMITINPVLEVGAFEEVLTITGEAPIIDMESTEVGEVLTQELISKLPTPRFPTALFAMTAGNIGGDTVTMGGASNANSYKLDGIDVSDPQTHTVWVFVNMESIEEMEILPIMGATADVGGFTGAAMNMVTKSGGNEFSGGGAFYYFDDNFLNENNNDDDLFANTLRESKNNDRTFFLGGPIVKDQIWFYSNLGFRNRERVWGEDFEFPLTYEYRNNMVKVTSMLTDTMTLGGTWHYDNYLRERRGSGYNVEPEATVDQEGPNKSVAADLVWAMDDNNLFELKFHGWDGYFALMNNGGPIQYYDYQLDLTYGGSGYDYRADRQRIQATAKYTKFVDDMMGDHNFKFGAEWQRGQVIENDEWDYIEIWMGNLDWRYNYFDYYYEAITKDLVAYATDGWTVNDKLHVNAGLRFENQKLDSPDFTTPSGGSVSGNGEIHSMNLIAPRFGFTYKLDEDGTMLVRGSVGRYYESIVSGQLDMFMPNASVETAYYHDGSQWIAYWSNPLGFDDTVYSLDGDLTQSYTDAITFGGEKDFGGGIVLGADVIFRQGRNFIVEYEDGAEYAPVDITSTDGQNFTLWNQITDPHYTVTNGGDDLYVDYKALVLRATKRYSNNWQIQSSLTISELTGTAASDTGGSGGQTTGGLDFYEEHLNNQINRDGLLGGHRPIIFKLNGTYTFPYEISVSAIMDYTSGRRWSPRDRYSGLWQGRVYFLTEPRGSRTYDDTMNIDLRIEKTFRLDRFTVQILGDVYNLFNSDTVNSLQTNLYNSDFGDPLSTVPGRHFQVGARVSF